MMISRGDIYMAILPPDEDGESLQQGRRPILVISNNLANKNSPVLTVLPLSSRLRKKPLPTHVIIEGCGTQKKSIVLAEQIMRLNKKRILGRRMGTIKETVYESQVDQAIKIQLGV
ncbi:MAG: type II toxin-antitoxin system PemK/MazF family toxin [Lachnospiraceae bacterium]|nr:type II toxin-antitoxin system PemK/MazF family toxin [Lachnospiraceae bacterium]